MLDAPCCHCLSDCELFNISLYEGGCRNNWFNSGRPFDSFHMNVHRKGRKPDFGNLLDRLDGASASCRGPILSLRGIDPCAGRRAALGKTTARRTRTPPGRRAASHQPSHARGVARSVACTPPSCTVLGAADNARCSRFLDDWSPCPRTCGVLRARRPRRQRV